MSPTFAETTPTYLILYFSSGIQRIYGTQALELLQILDADSALKIYPRNYLSILQEKHIY